MSDYIKREDVWKTLARCFDGRAADIILEGTPSADVAPVRHGHWIFNQEDMTLHCSYCGEVFRFEDTEKDECLDFMEYAKYCLACGAKMGGGDSDQE